MKRIVAENIHFIIHIQKGSGNFEIVENGQLYVSGKVRIPDDENKEMMYIPDMEIEDDGIRLTTEDVYKEFKLRGYGYTGPFRQILSSNGEGKVNKVLIHLFCNVILKILCLVKTMTKYFIVIFTYNLF